MEALTNDRDAASRRGENALQSSSLPLSSLTTTTAPTVMAVSATPERCPICFANPLEEPFATRCGHVFCYDCLRTHLDEHRFCPQCREFTTPESIVPAFLANNTNRDNHPNQIHRVTANSPSPAINNNNNPPAIAATPTPPLVTGATATGNTTPNLRASYDAAPTPRTPQHAISAATPHTPRTPHITTTTNATSASTPRTPRNPIYTTSNPHRSHTPITDNSDRPPEHATPSTAAESPAPGLARISRRHNDADDDVTPDLTDALSSRRRSPPRIHRNPGAARSDKSPASRRRARAAMVAVGAELSSAPSVNNETNANIDVDTCAHVIAPVLGAGPSTQSAKQKGAAALNTSVAALLQDDNADPDQIAAIIEMLQKKRNDQNTVQKHMRSALLHEFLFKTRTERLEDIARLKAEVAVLDMDLNAIESNSMYMQKVHENPAWNGKRRRVNKNYEPLKESYFTSVATTPAGSDKRRKALSTFTDDIMKVTQYSRFRCRASLLHVARHSGSTSNIVSSIEFDRESRLLATAGVTKRIKLFEFPTADDDSVRLGEHHYPVKEVVARAKLSWVCWNPYIRQQLVSSDYDGIVTLWDINRGVAINEYEEHDKRVWSVDFCTADPRVFASGSDDGKVKIWTTAQSNSAVTIGKGCANVCSVKFQPDSMYTLAFGSADHHVHYYDIRYPDTALQVFEGHERTVSYVKFMSPTEMVSACVDSTIKLWSLESGNMELKRTYTGHVNDKNFVGLSVTDEYLACGSEKNSIFAYYKSIPKPFAKYRFPESDLVTGAETQEDDESFVSSVCWCPKNPKLLVGANSVGIIKVLQLAEDEDSDSEDHDEEEPRDDDDKSDFNSSRLST